jgi:hypothetical protein
VLHPNGHSLFAEVASTWRAPFQLLFTVEPGERRAGHA